MIFVWSSEGPLRYIGPALIILQLSLSYLNNLPENSVVLPLFKIALQAGTAILCYRNRDYCQSLFSWVRGRSLGSSTSIFLGMVFLLFLAVAFNFLINIASMQGISITYTPALYGIGLIFSLITFLQATSNNVNTAAHNNHPVSAASKLNKIVKVVQKMPIEEFVSDLNTCSISQLKKLVHGEKHYVERQELIQAIHDKRNATCCICYEEYQDGDPLRIVPSCGHEFHVECMDQWAYSFANKAEQEPTCPLCNASILCER
mmetsp:Transcript_17508/g.26579  ORF Transcript_17508/g.26579 Transcript_17508/m.26579 type:complete len:260 (+) Transcript_17508:184-963(+)